MTPPDLPVSGDAERGLIARMAKNRVTPNLLMITLLVGGFYSTFHIKQEVFPEFDLGRVSVMVPYPGASPAEVEQGIILAVEEGIQGIEGIKELTAKAGEGYGSITAELLADADDEKAYQEIQQAVARIVTFPEDAERPRVTLLAHRREVINLALYGDASEWALRELVEQTRDRLLQQPGITQVDLLGARGYEVRVEIPQERLRSFNLTLEQVARQIASTAIELPGGKIETHGGEILLRINERRSWAAEFERLPIVSTTEGSVVTLAELGRVVDDFEETNRFGSFDGHRAVGLSIYRVGEQTPLGVADAVREALPDVRADLPPGVHLEIVRDRSKIYQQRLELLMRNAAIGLGLVLVLLGLFLEVKVAFWVTVGIPTSFLGAFLILPFMGVTINMVSMFAFIVALGIVVDDAIVAGENIFEYRSRGMGSIQAAIRGAREVMVPVTFSILTNMVAFMPLMFVPGVMGKIWRVIPLVVITVFAISWVEALLILPAHLGHGRRRTRQTDRRGWSAAWRTQSDRFVSWVTGRVYRPFLTLCIRHRLVTISVGIATLVVVVGYVASGRMGLILMPRVESDRAVVTAVLPYGSPIGRVVAARDQVVDALERVAVKHGRDALMIGSVAIVDENEVEITAYLQEPHIRPISTGTLTQEWREELGELPGLQSLRFESDRGGPGSGAAITVELSHRDIKVLDQASTELALALAQFPNVRDVDDGFTPGKPQLDFKLRPEGHILGLTVRSVARQVRSAFYGSEALRQQRGRNEVKVRVTRPVAERASEYDVEQMLIRAPSGRDVPLLQVADLTRGNAYTTISRRDGRRTVTVTANVVPIKGTQRILSTLTDEVLPDLARNHMGLTYNYRGRQARMGDALGALRKGFMLALLVIYILLAIPFRSYAQPAIVMTSIPFAMVGAVMGHLVMDFSLSLMSLMGAVALSGVVVNDALVLIDYANRCRAKKMPADEAIVAAGMRRFRPVILTTLTTFGGLAPMIFETSRQARFMVPMAISLGFGIMFATAVTLVLVPCLYQVVDDLVGDFYRRDRSEPEVALPPGAHPGGELG